MNELKDAKLVAYITASEHQALKEHADREHVSVSALVGRCLRELILGHKVTWILEDSSSIEA